MKNTFVFKTDLALAYFPHLTPNAARNKLMALINAQGSLLRERLQNLGYIDSQREFTPAQVSVIMDLLGNPF